MLPLELQRLIDRFADNYEQYKDSGYNETELRREFLDKFIKVLGWDVDNEQGFSETFKEVVHEDKLKIGTQTKAPDYCVQIGGRRLFFIEAKKPAIDIKSDISPAFQVRRYGWNAKMPFCLLTNFEEYAVYDASHRPVVSDKASTARLLYCKYSELDKPSPYPNLTYWGYIYGIFGKESVLHGSLEKRDKLDKKKGTQEVDEAFLKDIEEWRERLASNIILRNKVSERELNSVVQKTIDRIIFLRICEDRNIENENTLKDIASSNIARSTNIYDNLIKLFKTADEKYNSGLFHFKEEKTTQQPADTISSQIKIDNIILKKIIQGLYYPAPYQFNIMPADILGSIYERFLGKVIRISSEHRAKVEDKPEVKKAGGVYYTPSYIVDYIVKNTIGKQLESKSIKTIGNFRILDPACGSGSFLIVAYQYLLDWYLTEYIKSPNNYKKEIIKVSEKNYKLSIQERKRILTAHIFGVDIDNQAVEVSKLSLLLKALEGLTGQEIQQSLFNERVLPNLAGNIKCGNSLIGGDFYRQGELALDENEQYKINAFDWQVEFKEVFADGGFDAVIGNPPYVRIHEISNHEKEYYKKNYVSASNQFDLYQLFYEKALKLIHRGAKLGFITSNKFAITNYGKILREYLFDNYNIVSIVDASHIPVFNASTYPFIMIIENNKNKENKVNVFITTNATLDNKLVFQTSYAAKQQDLLFGDEKILSLNMNRASKDLLKKIEKVSSDTALVVYRGRGTSKDISVTKPVDFVIAVTNKQIKRFILDEARFYRKATNFINDFEIKLIMKKLCYSLDVSIDENGEINPINTTYVVKSKNPAVSLKFVLGILCSKLLTYYARNKYISTHMRGGYIELRAFEVEKLPILNIDLSKKEDKAQHDKLVVLVEKMLEIKKKESESRDEQSKIMYSRQALVIDKEIDALVYSLYGLTQEEIKTVENA